MKWLFARIMRNCSVKLLYFSFKEPYTPITWSIPLKTLLKGQCHEIVVEMSP
jgi:hypothetical protein